MAQGDYGTSGNPIEEIHGEQIVYEPLTADPPSSEREEGSRWFRSDLDSGDKIGTLRIQNDDAGNDIDDQPVFPEASTVDGVTKAKPVATVNGEGFAPYVQEGGAFDQLRFQHNGTWYGAHDSLSPIPDSVVYQYLVENFSTSTWTDSVASANMSVNGMVADTFTNGYDSVFGDGTDDYGTASGPETIGQNQTFGLALTIQVNSNGGVWLGVGSGSNNQMWLYDSDFYDSTFGEPTLKLADGNGNAIEEQSTTQINDGNPHPLIINKNSNSSGGVEFYIDDMSNATGTATNIDQAFDHTAFNPSNSLGFFASNDGSIGNYAGIELGAVEFNSEPYTESERQNFVSRRPEV